MKTRIILSIFVVFFFVISSSCSLLRGEGNSVAKKSPRRPRRNTCPQGRRRNFQTDKCEAICSKTLYPCVHGNCGPNNTCDCDFGYELSKNQTLVCERIECDEDCRFGKCSAKNQPCQCDKGYVRSGKECRPAMCENPKCIEHEECLEDNRCTCVEGYGKSSYDSRCKPWCKSDQIIDGLDCTPRSSAASGTIAFDVSLFVGMILLILVTEERWWT